MKPIPMSEQKTFEERLKELEGIIGQIESGQLPLNDLVNVHQRGKVLLDSLESELKSAQALIEIAQTDGSSDTL